MNNSIRIALAVSLACAAACSDDETTATREVEIRFDALVGGAAAACGTDYTDIGASGATMRLQDLRFYVSDVQLITAGGDVYEVELEDDGTWQGQGVALLDFEDGSAECGANGNSETRDVVRGTVVEGDYSALRFTLGIPSALNHQDTAAAPAPFNLGAMFWVWQTGYKFLRVDMMTEVNGAPAAWNIHLGSTGCESAAPTTAPATACSKPNRPTYTFEGFDPDTDTVAFDLAELLDGVDIAADTPDTSPGCMSNPGDVAECTTLFTNMGIDFASGGASSCGFDECQRLFSLR